MTAGYGDGFTDHFYLTPDGLTLYARIYGGDIGGIPVVCLPGLSRNSRDFHQLALHLSQQPVTPRRVVCLDYRGRGRSDRDADSSRYNLVVEAGDVITACASLDIARCHFIGTSRGGLTLHLLVQMRPDLIESLVLNDVGPVLEVEGLRHIQAYLGRERHPRDWPDAAQMLRHTHGAAFPLLDDEDWADLAHAIYREAEGEIVPDFDPVIAEQIRALDLSGDIPDLWPQFDAFGAIPVMIIRGEHSQLLSEGTVSAMAERHPGLRVLQADGQGHAPILHLGGIAGEILEFLSDGQSSNP